MGCSSSSSSCMMCDVLDVFRILEARAYQANELLLTTFLKISFKAFASIWRRQLLLQLAPTLESLAGSLQSHVAATCGAESAQNDPQCRHNGCVSLQNETK